jgi:hypothetical protein
VGQTGEEDDGSDVGSMEEEVADGKEKGEGRDHRYRVR